MSKQVVHKLVRDPEKHWRLGILCLVTEGYYENSSWNLKPVTCPDCLKLVGPTPDESDKTIHIRNDAQTVDKGPVPQYTMTYCNRMYLIRSTRPVESATRPLLPGWEICTSCLCKLDE